MTRPWEGIQVPDDLKNGGVTPPFVQWVNAGQALQPRQDRGGWFMPERWDVAIPGEFATLYTSQGNSESGVYAQELAFVPVAQRFHWVNALGEILPGYQDGARGWLQVLALLPGEDGGVFWGVITVKGIASRDLGRIIREHQNAAADVRGQGWMFWLRAKAGEQRMVGERKRSLVTTIEPAGELRPEEDFIGRGLVQAIIEWRDFIRDWRSGEVITEWPERIDQATAYAHRAGGVNGNGTTGDASKPTSSVPSSKPEPVAVTATSAPGGSAGTIVTPDAPVTTEEARPPAWTDKRNGHDNGHGDEGMSLLEAMHTRVKSRKYGEVSLQDLAYKHRDTKALQWLAEKSQNARLRLAAQRVLRHLATLNTAANGAAPAQTSVTVA